MCWSTILVAVWQEVFDNKDKVKEDTIVEVWKGGANAWGKTMSEVIRIARRSRTKRWCDDLHSQVTKSGLRGILSSPWYLNYIRLTWFVKLLWKRDPNNWWKLSSWVHSQWNLESNTLMIMLYVCIQLRCRLGEVLPGRPTQLSGNGTAEETCHRWRGEWGGRREWMELMKLFICSISRFKACMWGEFVNSVNLIPRLWPRASAVAERLWSPATATNVKEAAQRLQEMECRLLQRGYPVEPANGPGFCDVVWEGPWVDGSRRRRRRLWSTAHLSYRLGLNQFIFTAGSEIIWISRLCHYLWWFWCELDSRIDRCI